MKADAQAAVEAAGDEVALLHARYNVRRAELETQANELVSDIKAKQNVLLLEEARQRLAQVDADLATHRTTSHASAAGLREKRNKAQLAVQVAERNIGSLAIRAPFDGYVTIRTNFMAFGGIGFPGMPEYRVGDSTFAGQPIADVFDTSEVEVTPSCPSAIARTSRPVRWLKSAVDAAAGARSCAARSARSAASPPGRSSTPARGSSTSAFDVTGQRPGAARRHRPRFQSPVRHSTTSLYVPRTAVFDAAGKPTVYVRTADGFDAREVRVRAWTDSCRHHREHRGVRGSRVGQPECGVRRTAASLSRRRPRRGAPRDDHGASAARPKIGGRAVAARRRPQPRQPAAPQAAHAADDARDDLRRRGGAGDAVNRRRRAAAGDGVHRGAGRQEPDRRSARDHGVAGVPESTPAVAGPDVSRHARDPGDGPGPGGAVAAQAVLADAGRAEAAGRASRRLRRRTELPADCRSAARRGTFLHGRRSGARQRGLRARRGGARAAVRTRRPARTLRQDEPAVVPRHRHRRPPGRGAERRRRRAGAGSQQSGLRANRFGDASPGRHLQPVPRRDRRPLYPSDAPTPTSPPPRRPCAASSRHRTAAPTTTR